MPVSQDKFNSFIYHNILSIMNVIKYHDLNRCRHVFLHAGIFTPKIKTQKSFSFFLSKTQQTTTKKHLLLTKILLQLAKYFRTNTTMLLFLDCNINGLLQQEKKCLLLDSIPESIPVSSSETTLSFGGEENTTRIQIFV